jgi:hypothetical protein
MGLREIPGWWESWWVDERLKARQRDGKAEEW